MKSECTNEVIILGNQKDLDNLYRRIVVKTRAKPGVYHPGAVDLTALVPVRASMLTKRTPHAQFSEKLASWQGENWGFTGGVCESTCKRRPGMLRITFGTMDGTSESLVERIAEAYPALEFWLLCDNPQEGAYRWALFSGGKPMDAVSDAFVECLDHEMENLSGWYGGKLPTPFRRAMELMREIRPAPTEAVKRGKGQGWMLPSGLTMLSLGAITGDVGMAEYCAGKDDLSNRDFCGMTPVEAHAMVSPDQGLVSRAFRKLGNPSGFGLTKAQWKTLHKRFARVGNLDGMLMVQDVHPDILSPDASRFGSELMRDLALNGEDFLLSGPDESIALLHLKRHGIAPTDIGPDGRCALEYAADSLIDMIGNAKPNQQIREECVTAVKFIKMAIRVYGPESIGKKVYDRVIKALTKASTSLTIKTEFGENLVAEIRAAKAKSMLESSFKKFSKRRSP